VDCRSYVYIVASVLYYSVYCATEFVRFLGIRDVVVRCLFIYIEPRAILVAGLLFRFPDSSIGLHRLLVPP